jgi:hypothetical protein
MAHPAGKFVSLPCLSAWTRLSSRPFQPESVISRARPFWLRLFSSGRFGIWLLELHKACFRKMVVLAHLHVGSSILMMATDGHAPSVHKARFMDQLHEGDKILFAPKCGKHNRCQFWLPNPDKTGKEVATLGSFEPTVAKGVPLERAIPLQLSVWGDGDGSRKAYSHPER